MSCHSLIVLRWQSGHSLWLLPVGCTLGRHHCGRGGLHWYSHLVCWHGYHNVVSGHHATTFAARTTPSQWIRVVEKATTMVAFALDVDINIINVIHFYTLVFFLWLRSANCPFSYWSPVYIFYFFFSASTLSAIRKSSLPFISTLIDQRFWHNLVIQFFQGWLIALYSSLGSLIHGCSPTWGCLGIGIRSWVFLGNWALEKC